MNLPPEFLFNYFTVVSFVLGACIGSFLNVCIYRIPLEQSVVRPGSHCPSCNTPIKWYDNIPLVSWIALGAKCRHCRGRISPRYILVEVLVALLFMAVFRHYGFDARTPVFWLAMSGLVLGTFVDFDHMIIPDRVSLGGIAAGLLLAPLVPAMHGTDVWWRALMQSAIGAAAGYGSLWAVAWLGEKAFKKEAMGMGDVKLLGAIGAFLGWPAVLFTIFVSSLTGSLVGVTLIVTGRKELQSHIPFGPYLAVGAAVWILGGDEIWIRYIRWMTRPLDAP